MKIKLHMLCSAAVGRKEELMDCPASARSITYEGIREIVKLMAPADEAAPFTSKDMQKIFQGLNTAKNKFHPMEQFEQFYTMRPPDFAVTYVWGMDFRKRLPLYMESVERYVKSSGFVHGDIERKFE
jgi:hypothetical protein